MSSPEKTAGLSSRIGGDLKARLITGFALAPLLILLGIYGPNLTLWLVIAAAATVGSFEFTRMSIGGEARLLRVVTALASIAVLAALYLSPSAVPLYGTLAGGVLAILMVELFTVRDIPSATRHINGALGAFVYVAMLFGGLVLVSRSDMMWEVAPQQAGWFLFPLVVVFAGDTGAYFAGRLFGRRKLAPVVSPGKTWEGAAGGLASSVLGAFVLTALLLPDLSPTLVLLFAVPGAMLAQTGDLAESLLKRSAGVKDSGSLLRGHGGILDRADGLLFAAPYFALLKLALGN